MLLQSMPPHTTRNTTQIITHTTTTDTPSMTHIPVMSTPNTNPVMEMLSMALTLWWNPMAP
ncbi:hypothetical protein WDU94_015322 [Cyamophila willieti]